MKTTKPVAPASSRCKRSVESRWIVSPGSEEHTRLGVEVGVDVALGAKAKTTWGDAAERDIAGAIVAACDDLERMQRIITNQNWARVAPTIASRLPARPERRAAVWTVAPRQVLKASPVAD